MRYEDEYSFCRPYLTAGEYVLWKGKPEKGNLITKSDIYMIPFSILWCGFAFFWEILVILEGIFLFSIFGIPFVAMGLYFVFGRFLWTAYSRKKTFYVITNKKIIRSRNGKIDFLDGKTMPSVRAEIFKNGNGTFYFGQPNNYRIQTMNLNVPGFGAVPFTLENVAAPALVQQQLSNMER